MNVAPSALIIMAANVTANAVSLSWKQLAGNDTGGSPITSYIITYYYINGSEETKWVNNNMCNVTNSYVFTQLKVNVYLCN